MTDPNLDELARELADFDVPERQRATSTRHERVIAGFEEIQRFVQQHGRPPQHGENRDIFERLYAVRLDRLRADDDCRMLLRPLDHQQLLAAAPTRIADASADLDQLLAELSVGSDADITSLRHVRTAAEKRAAEEIADRKVCEDFDGFRTLFDGVKRELESGVRRTLPITETDEVRAAEIKKGDFFIINGQIAFVAEVGEEFTTKYDRKDSRLRVIYDNATESDVLQRSLQRALHRDEAARRITNPNLGPLFADVPGTQDLPGGTIYVLRSKSENPIVAAHRDVLHKIGVTGSKMDARLANARTEPTFLLADVDVVATYELYNVNRVKLENLIHRVFDNAQLDIEIMDRFGNPVRPREWFLVPLSVIDEAVSRIKDGSITDYVYEPAVARLVARGSSGSR